VNDEHGHSPEEIAARLSPGHPSRYLRDAVFGAIDGAVTTFAIVAGVAGAGLPNSIIVVLGCANILADGFSMAAGNYAGTKADVDDRNRIIAIEERHIRFHPEGEREELRQILALRGLAGDVLEQAVEAIASQKRKWIEFMLVDEYGLPRDPPNPWRQALATFVAFLLAGIVPLAPFLLGTGRPFDVSVVATLITFFLIGAAKSRWSLAPWWRSSLETLLIGSFAAAVAFAVGSLFNI
jgi:VIT1/CCC1 family predicted Fe2+/Mn2+ transporter